MTTTPHTIATTDELEELDWELPFADARFPDVDDVDFDELILAFFETFNGVELFGEALNTFRTTAPDYYREG